MKATSLIWIFDNRLHDVNDKKYKDLKVPTKVAILNQAIVRFYTAVAANRDSNDIFKRWLSPLEKTNIILKVKESKDNYVVYEYPDRFGVISTVEIDAKKGNCSATFEANPLPAKSIKAARFNEYWEPDFEFEQTYRDEDADGVNIYHEKKFDIENARISYLKNILPVHVASLVRTEDGYTYHDGQKIVKDVDLEFGEGAEEPIIDIAVLLASDDGGDINLQVNKILNIKQNLNNESRI